MNEVAVIDVIERILSEMLEDAQTRARVVAFFYDKYGSVEGVPQWENEAGRVATPAVSTQIIGSSPGWGSPGV